MMINVSESIENFVEKGENTGYQYFLLFLQSFQKAISLTVYYTIPTFNDPVNEGL